MTSHVTTGWLADHIDDENVRVIDIRGQVRPATDPPPHYISEREAYAERHIPGAVFVDWIHEITDPNSPHHAQIAPPGRFAALMSRLGVTDDTHVIAYDNGNGMFAARLWWALTYYGHKRASILDGGWAKWTSEDRPTTDQLEFIFPAEFTARPNPALIRNADDVHAALSTAAVLLDVRSPAEYNGEASRIQRKGHIPGALNLPRKSTLQPDGTPRPPDTLRADLTAQGITPQTEIITYCNAGVSAAYVLLALHTAGYHNVALYDGSWKDWGSDETNPVE